MARSEPERVLHIVSRLAYYGAENFVHELATAQMNRGSVVAVLTMYDSPVPIPDTPVREICVRRRSGADLTFLPRLVAAVKSFRPGVVHTHVHNGKYWGRLAALSAGVTRIVHTEHNSAFSGDPLARLGNRVLHPFTRRIVALTRAHAAALARAEAIAPAKIAVIPNGITASRPPSHDERANVRAQLGLEAEQPAVFHVGRLTAVKNQRLALEALLHIRTSLPGVRLYFIGAGEDEEQLRAAVRTLQLTDNVVFLGFRRDVRTLLAAADVLLITSRNEAMPIAALEALFAGVPVVSTPWCGADEVLGDAGTVCEDWSAGSVASNVCLLLDEPRLHEHYARRGIAMAHSRYRIEATAEAYARTYAEC